MRRSEIIEGVQQVINAIKESKILENISKLIGGEKKGDSNNAAMESIKNYFAKSQNFNSAARRIVEILDLEILENPKFWVIVASSTSTDFAHTVPFLYRNLNNAVNYLPQIIKLLDREYSNLTDNGTEPFVSNGKEMKLLSVTVFENDKRLSSPQRLVNVLESVNAFYTSCAYMTDESPDTLSVVGCDSGSDKSFDFLGVAKVIECVTQLIENLWDRVVFYREKQLEARLDLINQSLPIYEKLSELEKGEKIAPELAERLRRNLFEGVNKFVESGASIPEVDARSSYSSRSLLSPVQKLLVSAPEETEKTEHQQRIETPSINFNDMPSERMEADSLSSDEQKQLFKLMRKMQQTPKNQTDDIANETDFFKNDGDSF